MDRPLFAFLGALLGFLAAFIPYISDRKVPIKWQKMLREKWRKTVPQKWGNVGQGNWWPIAWWAILAGAIILYAGYGYHLDKVEQREQARKDADHEKEVAELKNQIRTMTDSERRSRLISEAAIRRWTTGEVREPPVDALEPGMTVDLSAGIAAPPTMTLTWQPAAPPSSATKYGINLLINSN